MILLDTNILVFAHSQKSPHQNRSAELVDQALQGKFPACIAHQNLLEFLSVVTHPKKLEKPLSRAKALSCTRLYLLSAALVKIAPTQGSFMRAHDLISRHSVSRTKVFDAYLAATMLDNGVKEIYTDNVSDFEAFEDITATNPL